MRKVLISDGKVYVTDERWVTIGGEDEDGSGQHVLIKENGNIVAGFGTGKNVRSVFGEKKADTPGKANAAVKKASQIAKNQVLNFRFNDPKAFADSEAEAKEKLNKAREMARKYPTDKDAQRRLAEAKGYVDGYKERREKGQVPKSWEEREAKRKRERLDTPKKVNAAVRGDKNLISRLEKTIANAEEDHKRKPYNVTIVNTIRNNKEYLKHAKTIDLSKNKFSGIKAALAINSLDGKNGATFKIGGTKLYDGEYTIKYWSAPGYHGGYVAERKGDGRQIGINLLTLADVLDLGGSQIQNNRNAKVTIVKR